MNKIINPPSNCLEATSFDMADGRKKKVKLVVGGKGSRHVDVSGAAPDVGVPLIDHFPPELHIVHEAVVGEEAGRRVEDEGTEVTTSPKLSLLVELCQLNVGCQ